MGNKGAWLNFGREQGNKAKILKGTREHVPPWETLYNHIVCSLVAEINGNKNDKT